MSLREKNELLNEEHIITAKEIMAKLGMSKGAAYNLISRWTKDGIIKRTGRGCYVTARTAEEENKTLTILKSIAKITGPNIILVGPSAWAEHGWCNTDTVYAICARKPSHAAPQVDGALVVNVGSKLFNMVLRQSTTVTEKMPPALNPVSQMIWWMSLSCPIPMADPDLVDWDKVEKDKQLPKAIEKHSPNLGKIEPKNIPILYTVLYEQLQEMAAEEANHSGEDHHGDTKPSD